MSVPAYLTSHELSYIQKSFPCAKALRGCSIRTFSARPPTRRRWGTQAGTVSSAPPLRSLYTWRWSWAATGGPAPSRTLRLCWRSPRRSGRPCRASMSPCSWVAWALKGEDDRRHECLSCRKTCSNMSHTSWRSLRNLSLQFNLSVWDYARSEGGPGLMKRPRAGHLLLFNVARHSHYNIIDCWLARAPPNRINHLPVLSPRPV